MDRQVYEKRNSTFRSFYYPGAVRLSYFFKADSQPEVLANEHLDNTAIDDSCFLEIEELNRNYPSFRDKQD